MASVKKVWYNDDDEGGTDRDKDRIGWLLGSDGDKGRIQIANGTVKKMAYREPHDANNTTPNERGLTYWHVA